MNPKHFTPPFFPASLPPWRCPQCRDGALSLLKESLRKEETPASKRNKRDPDGEPEWFQSRFSMLLRCLRCDEPVFVLGDVRLVEDHDDEHGRVLTEALIPTFFEPATPIIQIPSDCPVEVSNAIIGASALFWHSPSSAANRVRAAVEHLMDDRGISRRRRDNKNKLHDVSLHARIERFAKKHTEVGRTLLAIKWLGNVGSHSAELSASQMLDAFDLLSHAIEEIYEAKSSRRKKLESIIISRKGRAAK